MKKNKKLLVTDDRNKKECNIFAKDLEKYFKKEIYENDKYMKTDIVGTLQYLKDEIDLFALQDRFNNGNWGICGLDGRYCHYKYAGRNKKGRQVFYSLPEEDIYKTNRLGFRPILRFKF